MNKHLLVASVVLAMAATSFAQFGGRVSGGLNGLTGKLGKDGFDEGGYHIGVGGFMLQDLGFATLNIGANLLYKNVGGEEDTDDFGGAKVTEETYVTEIGLDIPILFRYSVNEQIYAEAGPQINLAFSSEVEYEASGGGQSISETEKFKERSSFDFGITVGSGYKINEKLSVDVRYFYAFNNAIDASGALDGGVYQVTVGVNYMF